MTYKLQYHVYAEAYMATDAFYYDRDQAQAYYDMLSENYEDVHLHIERYPTKEAWELDHPEEDCLLNSKGVLV